MGLYCLSQHLSLGLDLVFFSVCALSVGCSALLSVRKIRAIAIKAPFFLSLSLCSRLLWSPLLLKHFT